MSTQQVANAIAANQGPEAAEAILRIRRELRLNDIAWYDDRAAQELTPRQFSSACFTRRGDQTQLVDVEWNKGKVTAWWSLPGTDDAMTADAKHIGKIVDEMVGAIRR